MNKDNWHEEIKAKFLKIGAELGFHTNPELSIPRGWIDCVWEVRKGDMPPYYFAAFEFETSTTGPQIVENLVKELSIPPPKRPRFLIQVYRSTPKNIEYLEEIKSTLPVATKVIYNVGSDVDEASRIVLFEIFNWIGEYLELPLDFVSKVERVTNQNIPKIFHYGELASSHLRFLDSAIRYRLGKRPLWINSITTKKEAYNFPSLNKFDVVIISDVSTKYCDISRLQRFLREEVEKNGKTLILTGGYGLTKKYNLELGSKYIGGTVGKRFEKKEFTAQIKSGLGVGLTFKGFNRFEPLNTEEVKSRWDIEDSPALIVHKLGEGKVICFTSDCSPAWGIDAVKDQRFLEMWKDIRDLYVLQRKNVRYASRW